MIGNLGRFAHPKKKSSSVVGPQGAFPAPPKSKPDPINRNVNDVSMAGATPGTGAMPKGSIPSTNLATRTAPRGPAAAPGLKARKKTTVTQRAKKATVPFFGGY